MAGKSRKKAQQQRKRRKRKIESARLRAVNPYQRIGQSGEVVACYINENWDESGSATIFVLRRSRDQGLVLASFYVDLWCAGLKDAWGRLDITLEEFRERILDKTMTQFDLVRIDLGTIQSIVTGGIRFAHQNGFKLPHRYQRWTAILGDIGDWESADLRNFGVDGKLRYIGTLDDLNKRLIGCSVDDFLERDDIDFILGDDDFSLLDDDAVAFEELNEKMNDRIVSAVRQWCFANGTKPHSRLADAVDIMLESLMQMPESDEDVEDELDFRDFDMATMDMHVDRLMEVDDRNELGEALEQFAHFMSQFKNPEELINAVGFDQSDFDD